ncbi:hypothetical protein [Actinosynnema pretiosum]|uniref:hypothetical protein n=1 Tax=Actinosynnema pretiosum TaxID=42197 RepID=UPI0012FE0431|nr:hypothetical protein [Actinosynnema pretiosum]
MVRAGTTSGVHFLLSTVDSDLASAVRRRIDLPQDSRERYQADWSPFRSAILWRLENDDPEINRAIAHSLPDWSLRRRIATGVPFGPAPGPLPVLDCYARCDHAPPPLPDGADTTEGVIALLRSVTTLSAGKRAAGAVAWDDWEAVVAADRAEPLPGYAKWAVANRVDCPHEVRLALATHRKHHDRLYEAGLVRDAAEYALEFPNTSSVLQVLNTGRWAFPHRAAEAAAALGPLVREELGEDLEAWSVLAQVLPTFTGTAPELLRTCGAITRV